jgi:hypothetical protein
MPSRSGFERRIRLYSWTLESSDARGERSGARESASIFGSGFSDIAAAAVRCSWRLFVLMPPPRPSTYCAIRQQSGGLFSMWSASTGDAILRRQLMIQNTRQDSRLIRERPVYRNVGSALSGFCGRRKCRGRSVARWTNDSDSLSWRSPEPHQIAFVRVDPASSADANIHRLCLTREGFSDASNLTKRQLSVGRSGLPAGSDGILGRRNAWRRQARKFATRGR